MVPYDLKLSRQKTFANFADFRVSRNLASVAHALFNCNARTNRGERAAGKVHGGEKWLYRRTLYETIQRQCCITLGRPAIFIDAILRSRECNDTRTCVSGQVRPMPHGATPS